ncbi:putative Flp pilus-assembly TadE/G-like protein [Kribbella voronezhensis]|uniref:Putative Flp pilus-assembly TadE/G-like protein n=1 Tax=Kribbella voronezhensis TaxID=2512212 RepID=A0A4R7T3Y7_9ACTN|nr:TadE/TadG family type IV pilus assembly protein [Kribbella voronezhensis]TDU86500.1 putative Flp pilus-assembly TadE/G-like protein [Kribbella voronezhensis]
MLPDPGAGRGAWRRTVAYLRIDAPRANRLIDALRNHRGALSPAVAILAVMIFTLAGLVIDGGRQLGAKSRAVGYAQEAARAGVATIDFNSSEAKIDVSKAGAAVANFCAQVRTNDPAVTGCGATELDAEHLKVDVQIDNKTSFLGMVGIKNLTAKGQGEAHAEQGVKKADDSPTIPPIVVETSLEGPGAPITSANPPTIDFPCPSWTIGSPTPPWTPPIPLPFPASCKPTITPTDSPDPSGPNPSDTASSSKPTESGSSSAPPGGGAPAAPAVRSTE